MKGNDSLKNWIGGSLGPFLKGFRTLWGVSGVLLGALRASLGRPAAPKFARLASSGFSSPHVLLLLASLN